MVGQRYGLGFYSLDKRGQVHLERLAADPVLGKRDLIAIDQLLVKRITAQARLNGLPVVEIDGLRSVAEGAEHFGLHDQLLIALG